MSVSRRTFLGAVPAAAAAQVVVDNTTRADMKKPKRHLATFEGRSGRSMTAWSLINVKRPDCGN